MVAAFYVYERSAAGVRITTVDFDNDRRIATDGIDGHHMCLEHRAHIVNERQPSVVRRPVVTGESSIVIARHDSRNIDLVLGEEMKQ